MRIVNFDDFCKMPAGTIFAPYEPCTLRDDLAIKVDEGREMPPDYKRYKHTFNGVMPLQPWLDGLVCCLFEPGDTQEASFEIYDGDNNDYCDYKMFLVFDESDLDKMIGVLKWAKNRCVGEPDDYIEKKHAIHPNTWFVPYRRENNKED